MEVLRITFTQNQANYRKEESMINKMTYPLPPFSTMIGAIHKACGFSSYQPMALSIQGSYQSMGKEAYTDYCFLNNIMDDRGILVKLKNPQMLSSAYEVVAKAQKSQGNSFQDGTTIAVIRGDLLEEYRQIRNKRDQLVQKKKEVIEPQLKQLAEEKKKLSIQQKQFDKKSPEFAGIKQQIEEINQARARIDTEFKQERASQVEQPYSYFASLTTSLRFYEVLYGVTVVVHIASTPEILDSIEAHIYNMTAVGRSEDFVDITEVKRVNLTDDIAQDIHSKKNYSAYLARDLVSEGHILLGHKTGIAANGTVYYLNKNYTVVDGRRVFEKKPVVYCSNYTIDEESKQVFLDEDGWIVNLI